MATGVTPEGPAAPPGLRGLLVELNDLKRVRSAGRGGSIAERLFVQAWAALEGGADPEALALDVAAKALAAARLGDLDAAFLAAAGIPGPQAAEILVRGFDEVAGAVEPRLAARLRARLAAPEEWPAGGLPGFVRLLCDQPRAGVTCPGRPRVLLEPPENHAEHCLMVAVYGVVLSPFYGADPATVFVAALAHHLHNALMPDAGFTGEILLGAHLDAVIATLGERALGEIAPALRPRVASARRVLADDATAEGRAFHAADVIDRVLQIAQHLRAASLTMDTVLGEMALVHDGPVKAFHDRVLADMHLP
ncbi:hypothetical protein OPKNFCMD_0317 [Methylobacterium crusticola]|uniref:HD domain-containing protein n=1 Tax=Methylobacterium crusticola TaxID=1697972 RepID=A0ABQ4QQV5_9HYPH|nr:hypothetical protein [Methylobacterium crusticola]GJD47609.1 hypothetical protein OPKNFCMD_0317 [Methylobacterium crusticola]